MPMMTCALPKYEFIFTINLRFSPQQRKIKPRNNFDCSMISAVYFVILVLHLSFLSFLSFLSLFSRKVTLCAPFWRACMSSGEHEMYCHGTKRKCWKRSNRMPLLLLLLWNDSTLRFNTVYTKNNSIGNCVSILNVIIIVGTAILILVWLAYRVGFFSFFILFFSVSMIFSCTSIVWFERNGHSIWFFYW